MRLSFDPEQPDGFEEARDALVERFEAAGGADLGWVAHQLLDFKGLYLDGDLARWTDAQVEEIVLHLFPAKAMIEPDDLGEVIAGIAEFLRFLGREGLLAGGDDESGRLAGVAESLDPAFRVAASDPANWSPGKRLLAAVEADGVDVTDQDALDAWIDSFNAGSLEQRDAILGPLSAPPTSPVVGPLPPVVLPTEDELRSMVLASVWFQRLRRFVEYVGDGRALTDRGNLKLADGKALVEILGTDDRVDKQIGDKVYKTRSSTQLVGVDLTYAVALAAGFVAIERRKIVPGPDAGLLEREPVEAFYEAWLALIDEIGIEQYRVGDDRYGLGWYAEELDTYLPTLLVDLYRDQRPIDVEVLAEDAWAHLEYVCDLDHVEPRKLDLHREFVGSSLLGALDRLAEMGITRVEGVEETTDAYGFTRRWGGEASLTPLGTWAIHRRVAAFVEAPVVGSLRGVDAAELLKRASDLSEAEAKAEIDAWVDHRGDEAADLLVAALEAADETSRGLAFRALLAIGEPAAPAVERLAGHPDLDPYVTVWRVDTLAATEADMDCAGDPERFVRVMHAVLELWGPDALTGWLGPTAGDAGPEAMFEQAWRVERAETETVLAALGGSHPDKRTAKAARKALFKHRSRSS